MLAREYAINLHKNDMWGHLPFEIHLISVVNEVIVISDDSDNLSRVTDIAWLHDSLEDHAEVSDDTLSKFSKYEDTLSILTRKNGEKYADYIQRIADSGNREAILVKVADLSVNIQSAKESLKKRYSKALTQLKQLL